jgi:hypothetical protein
MPEVTEGTAKPLMNLPLPVEIRMAYNRVKYFAVKLICLVMVHWI